MKFILVFNTGDKVHVLFFIDIIFITMFMIRLIKQKQYPAWRENVERWRKRSKISFIFDS